MFGVEDGASRERKQIALDSLEVHLRHKKDVKARDFIHVKLPLINAHENHTISYDTFNMKKQRRISKKKQMQLEAAKLAAAQEEFKEKLKFLQDFSYICSNVGIIKNINTQLELITNYIKDAIPKDHLIYHEPQVLCAPTHENQEEIEKQIPNEPSKPPKPKVPRKRKRVQEIQKCKLYSF